jgi:hypothetical protein
MQSVGCDAPRGPTPTRSPLPAQQVPPDLAKEFFEHNDYRPNMTPAGVLK